ncbi:MAG: hypothetical protein MK193_02360 [Lentisphaeria bacterium]|nr:hypothetical protein [Lentisphaeria bacterium]
MMRIFYFLFVWAFIIQVYSAPKLPKSWPVKADKTKLDFKDKVYIAEGNTVLAFDEYTIKAGLIRYYYETGDFEASDNVSIETETNFWQGDYVTGNVKDREIEVGPSQAYIAPFYIVSESGSMGEGKTAVFEKVSFASCDKIFDGNSDWQLESQKITYHEDGHFSADKVVFRAFDIPLLYAPGVSGDKDFFENIELRLGDSSDWGFWVHVGYRFRINKQLSVKPFVEYRTKRGAGVGSELKYKSDRLNMDFLGHYIHDTDPLSDDTINGQDYNGRFETEEDRYRVKTDITYEFTEDIKLVSRIDYISDVDFLHEFYEDEYDDYPEPVTDFDLSWLTEDWEISVNYRPRLNDFYSEVEKEPEIQINLPYRRIGTTSVYYDGNVTFGRYQRLTRDYDLDRPDNIDDDISYDTFRFDTTHSFYRPIRLDWLKITPRAAFKYVNYSDSSESGVTYEDWVNNINNDNRRGLSDELYPVTDYDDDGGSLDRVIGEFGVESSFVLNSVNNDFVFEPLDWNGLRHSVEPYVNYTYIPNPSESVDNIYFFDEVDRIEEANFVRFGVKHYLDTKRTYKDKESVERIVNFEHFIDWYLDDDGEQPQAEQFGNVIEFDHKHRVGVWIKTMNDLESGDFNVFNFGGRLGNKDEEHVTLGFLYQGRYQQSQQYSFASDLTYIYQTEVFPLDYEQTKNIRYSYFVPITETVSFQFSHYWDLDEDDLAIQKYTLIKSWDCWTTSFGVKANDNSYSLELSVSLLPSVSTEHAR